MMADVLKCMKHMRWVGAQVVAVLVVALSIASASAEKPPISKTPDKVAINGYDTVAYFTDGKAIKGSNEYEVEWQDAHWYFASEDHQMLFLSAPSHYAPQFGGWCASGVASGLRYPPDPEAWAIVDGKLYLISSPEAAAKWQQDRANKIAKAERIWSAQAGSH